MNQTLGRACPQRAESDVFHARRAARRDGLALPSSWAAGMAPWPWQLPVNLVGTDSTLSLTLLCDRNSNIRDAVERVPTSSWFQRTIDGSWTFPTRPSQEGTWPAMLQRNLRSLAVRSLAGLLLAAVLLCPGTLVARDFPNIDPAKQMEARIVSGFGWLERAKTRQCGGRAASLCPTLRPRGRSRRTDQPPG